MNNQTANSETSSSERVPYRVQSIIYLFSTTIYQASRNLSNPDLEVLTNSQLLGTAFIGFAVPSWCLLTFVLWTIERKKPKESRTNVAMYLGIGFFLLAIYLKIVS